MKYILAGITAFIVLIGGIFFGSSLNQSKIFTTGSAFTPVQGTQFYLSGAGITSTQSTIQLTTFTTPDGRLMTMSMFGSIGYGVLEPGTSRLEDVTFTGITQNSNGTATLTGVTRGNDFISPYAASSTLAKSHAGGATFILSNSAGFYGQQFAFTNNPSTVLASWIYGSTTPPVYDADPIWANFSTQVFADVSYVNSVVASGCANGSTTVKGCVQTATARQAASSTVFGSTGAIDVLQSSYATDTPNTATRGSVVPMTTIQGFLSQAWLDYTQLFTFNGGILTTASSTFSATTTIANNSLTNNALVIRGISYLFPSAHGVSGTFLQENGSGTLSWGFPYITSLFSSTGSFTASTTVTIPGGTLTGAAKIRVEVGGNPTGTACIAIGSGSATTTLNCVSNALITSSFIVNSDGASTQDITGWINAASIPASLYKITSFTNANPMYIQVGANSGNINNFQVTLTTQ